MSSENIKKGYNSCINHLERYIEGTYSILKEGLKTSGTTKEKQEWKYELMCPIITFLQGIIENFKKLELNLDSHLQVHKTNLGESAKMEILNQLKITLDKGIKDSLIDQTQSLIKFEEVMFPKESNQQVYIGRLDANGMRHGTGSLSDGIMLYNGSWRKDKRHGFGIQVYDDGEIFAGQWYKGRPVIGRWVFDDQQVFYGIFNRTGDENTEWKLGLSSQDYFRVKKAERFFEERENWTEEDLEESGVVKGFEKVRNIFYHGEEASGLKNVYLKENQKIQIEVLNGDKANEFAQIQFLDGIYYKGQWKNFEPNLLGLVKVPGNDKMKLLTRTGRTLAYKRLKLHPKDALSYQEKLTERDLVTLVSELKTLKRLHIEFIDGTIYQGSVNENLEFHGYGVLKYPNGSFEHGLFTYTNGFLIKFSNSSFEALQSIDANSYFSNSYAYLESNPQASNVWVELIDGFGPIKSFLYKGGWYNFYPEGQGYFKYVDSQFRRNCTSTEEIMFNVIGYTKEIYLERIQANEDSDSEEDSDGDYKEMQERLRQKTDDFEFGDKTRYIGMAYSDKDFYYAHGFGFYYEKNGSVHGGVWEHGTLVFDKKSAVGMNQRSIISLRKGHHKVEYKNGVMYIGEWENYRWTSGGVLTHKDGKEEILDLGKSTGDDPDEILAFMADKTGVKIVKDLAKKRVIFVDLKTFTTGGRTNGLQNLYLKILERQKEQMAELIEHDFIDENTVKYNPASTVGGPTTIGNGFEIYWMDPENKNRLRIKEARKSSKIIKKFQIDNLYVYKPSNFTIHRYNTQDEKSSVQLSTTFDKAQLDKKIGEIDENAYFKTALKKDGTIDYEKTYKLYEDLEPRKPYTQVTYTGLLISTDDFFQITPEVRNIGGRYPEKPLSCDKSFLYAMHHLNKINGVCQVNKDKIVFYNGDEYQFLGPERSFSHSFGNYLKFTKLDELSRNTRNGIVYWTRLFSGVGLCRLDQDFTSEMRDEEFDYRRIDNGNNYQITFNHKEIFDCTWFDGVPFGNGYFVDTKIEMEDEEEQEEEDFNTTMLKRKTIKSSLLRPSSLRGGSSLRSGTTGALDHQFWYKYRVYDDESASDTLLMILSNKKKKHFRRVMMNIFETLQSITDLASDVKHNTSFYLNLPKFETEIKQEFKVYFENNVSSNPMSIYDGIVNKLHRNKRPLMEMKIEYPNGDIFEGQRDKRGMANGDGTYHWSEGFKYEGEFFLNEPYGEGEIVDCYGNKLKGFVFRGHVLNQPYGLDKVLDELKKMEGENGTLLLNKDLDLIGDSEIMMGSSKFTHIPIQYGSMYQDMKQSGKILEKMLEDIQEGEKDYKEEWSDLLRADVKQVLMSEEAYINDLIETGEINLSNFARAVNDMVKRRNRRGYENSKYEFIIKKLKQKGLTRWVKDQIIELVNDDEYEGVKLVYEKFKQEQNELRFFDIKDLNKRNLVMIAAHLGHKQLLLDMLTALRRFLTSKRSDKKTYKKNFKKVKKILTHRDDVGNNIIDLVCIRGYDVDFQEVYSPLSNPEENTKSIRRTLSVLIEEQSVTEEQEKDDSHFQKISDLAKKDLTEIARIYKGPKVYFDTMRMMKDDNRKLFSQEALSYENLYNSMQKFNKKESESSQIFFISDRAICLETIFLFTIEFNISVSLFLNKKKYDRRVNNPLHFTIFWGDLHATLAILKQNSYIMFWRNHNNELPPHVIRFSGKNKFKANAVFGSVLQEITRHFNFKVIRELLVDETGILGEHKRKVGVKDASDKDERRKEAEEMMERMEEGNNIEFDEQNIFLYRNNYVLKHDELCKQYLEFLKKRSSYKQLKKKYGIMKWLLFSEVSELESLQRNFLDYYKGSFDDYHDLETRVKYKEDLQDLLTWYVFIFGDAEINPEIYQLLGLDPFKLVLAGRNIFHFMCENNSYVLLGNFLNHIYEKCHSRNFDISIESFEDWDKDSLIHEKYEQLKENLNIETSIQQNTPAHLCVMNNSEECLDLLLKHNIDLDVINIRGRTVREYLKERQPYTLSADVTLRPIDISNELIEHLTKDILTTCRQHSLKYEYIDEADHKDLQIILRGSMYQLTDDLAAVRDTVLKQMNQFSHDFKESYDRISLITAFMRNLLQITKMNKYERSKKIDDFRSIHIGSKKNDKDLNTEMIYFLLTALEGERFVFIPQREVLETFFIPEFLATVRKFKYKKYEKMVKKQFLKKISKMDFSKPIPSSLKNEFSMDQLFCIEIKMKNIESEGTVEYRDLIQKHVVLNQINNIRRKYMKYGGGIRVELLKGFTAKKRSVYSCFLRPKRYKKWYILITVSDTLFKKIATEKQMEAYNFKNRYHTVFFENAIDSHEIEPLRHFQKVKIVMELINQEFDIDMFKSKGLVIKYFPLHDYKQRRLIYQLWSKNKWIIHFWDAFYAIDRKGLQVLSFISFYHGIQQGFYFGFLSLYTNAILYLAVPGLLVLYPYFANWDLSFVKIFSPLVIGLWSSIFVSMWHRREKELAFSFDALEDEAIKTVRLKYKGGSMIDEGTLSISKKVEDRWLLKLIFTILTFIFGAMFVVFIYLLVGFLSRSTINDQEQNNVIGTAFALGIGALNGTLNFIVSMIFQKIINKLVIWENHAYEENMRRSRIIKKVTFKVFSSLFTLIAQILIEKKEYNFISLQVFSNLFITTFLNYAKIKKQSVGKPFTFYLINRYRIFSYLLKLQCLRCRPLKGKIEIFKDRMIKRMLLDDDTRDTFVRYCLDNKLDSKLAEELKQKKWVDFGNEIRKHKINRKSRIDSKKRAVNKIFEKYNRNIEKFEDEILSETKLNLPDGRLEGKWQENVPLRTNRVFPTSTSTIQKRPKKFEMSENRSSHRCLNIEGDQSSSMIELKNSTVNDEWTFNELTLPKNEEDSFNTEVKNSTNLSSMNKIRVHKLKKDNDEEDKGHLVSRKVKFSDPPEEVKSTLNSY